MPTARPGIGVGEPFHQAAGPCNNSGGIPLAPGMRPGRSRLKPQIPSSRSIVSLLAAVAVAAVLAGCGIHGSDEPGSIGPVSQSNDGMPDSDPDDSADGPGSGDSGSDPTERSDWPQPDPRQPQSAFCSAEARAVPFLERDNTPPYLLCHFREDAVVDPGELPDAHLPATWETGEYMRNPGLASIRASEGYAHHAEAERLGGHGITVAVLDSGTANYNNDRINRQYEELGYHLDIPHSPELAIPRILTPRTIARSPDDTLPYRHGTQVAGIIAAIKNDGQAGMHGVAFNANLVSFESCLTRRGCTESLNSGLVLKPEAAAYLAFHIASAAGLETVYRDDDQTIYRSRSEYVSNIMNMSFVFPNVPDVPKITSAMRNAAGAGRIMVAALGNCGDGGFECRRNTAASRGIGPLGAPASRMADPEMNGFGLAVGSFNHDGTGKAEHSNTCGSVKQFCLMAPGEDIYTTTVHKHCTLENPGPHCYTRVTGTSFAAPHVAGAAAVVWAAFPNKIGNQVVERLLTTARRFADQEEEVSEIYGHGALDLGAALAPVGSMSLPVQGRGMVPVSDSAMHLPPGFAAPSGASFRMDAIAYDEQMFPFRQDLAGAFQAAGARSSESALLGFLSSLGRSSSIAPLRRDAAFSFTHDGDAFDPHRHAMGRETGEVRDYRLHFNPAPGLAFSIGEGLDSIGSSNGLVAGRMRRALFRDQGSVAPFAAFAGRGPGLSLDWRVNEDTSVDFVAKDGRGYFGSVRARLASLGATRRIGGLTLGARVGTLRESGSLVGIQAAGAFAGLPDGATEFIDLSAEGRLSDDLTLFGGLSHGVSAGGTSQGGSLVSRWGGARADSFAIGTEIENVWLASDRLTLTASLPFRAREATVYVDLPDREVGDGVVRYTPRTIDLTPRGRERRLQLVYEAGGGECVSAAIGGYARFEPGHDGTANPEFGAAAKMRVAF